MKGIITPIILIIVSIAVFLTYTDPAYNKIKTAEKDEVQYDEALNKSRELQTIRDSLLSKYNTFSPADIEKLEKLLPDNVDNVRLILEIDNTASKYGMNLRDVSVSGGTETTGKNIVEATAKDFYTITLSFSVSSSYANFVKFIEDLERKLRIVDVSRIVFKASDSDFNEYRVSIETYWVE